MSTRVTRLEAKPWSVYILRCADGTLYTGATNDVDARLERHGKGRGAAYTRSRLPVKLVFCEPAADRSAALRREAAIKRLTRSEKLLLVKPAPRRRRAT
jgi:putative endonuclease